VAYNRFSANYFCKEKNKTIITFPIKQLDMAPYCDLKKNQKTDSNGKQQQEEKPPSTMYDLIANVKHNNGITATEGYFNVHIWHKVSCFDSI
jgi:hypothetical protein